MVELSDGRLVQWFGAAATAALTFLLVATLSFPSGAVLLPGVLLLVGAMVGIALSFRHSIQGLASTRDEAVTDALTGLGNRRLLIGDLDDALAGSAESRTLLALFDLDGFKRYNDSFGHPAGDALLRRLGKAIRRAVSPSGTAYRLGGDEFCALVDDSDGQALMLCERAGAALSAAGEGFSITASYGIVAVPAEAETPETALDLADQRLYEHKGQRRPVAGQRETRAALGEALRARSTNRERLEGTAWLARAVARKLCLTSDEIDVVVRASELHDVGKLAVPDEILHKPAPLDASEWDFVRKHTLVGARLLSAEPALEPVAEVVRASHERYDGRGYPDGLSGEDIPLGARIVAVCDAYQAMTTGRSYGRLLSSHDALAELDSGRGSQFDPRVVDAFGEVLAENPAPPAEPADVDPAPPAHWRVGQP